MVLALGIALGALGRQVLAQIPFQLIRNEVVAKVMLNGQGPFTVFLDTGTAPSVIELKIARQIGLKLDSKGEIGSGGGTEQTKFIPTSLPKVGIGGTTFTNVSALAGDLSGLSKKFGQPIDAVLGDSLFSGRIVQFDFPRSTVRFLSMASYRNNRAEVLPFHHEGGEVRLEGLKVNGHAVLANLDTGSNSFLSLTPRGIRKLGLVALVAKSRIKQSAGFNGKYQTREGKVRSVQLGHFRTLSPTVGFWLPHTGHDDRPWDANIGNDFLRHYNVTIDYRASVVALEPTQGRSRERNFLRMRNTHL